MREQVAVVAQVFDALLKQLDPTRLPEKIVQVWKGWKEEFSTHLENLDRFFLLVLVCLAVSAVICFNYLQGYWGC